MGFYRKKLHIQQHNEEETRVYNADLAVFSLLTGTPVCSVTQNCRVTVSFMIKHIVRKETKEKATKSAGAVWAGHQGHCVHRVDHFWGGHEAKKADRTAMVIVATVKFLPEWWQLSKSKIHKCFYTSVFKFLIKLIARKQICILKILNYSFKHKKNINMCLVSLPFHI